jgi:hypothetical protein
MNEQWGKSSALCIALQDTISRMYFFVNIANFIHYYNPWRHFKLWKNYRTLANTLTPAVQRRMDALQKDRSVKGKTLVDLIVQALDAEKAEQKVMTQDNNDHQAAELDANFVTMAIG